MEHGFRWNAWNIAHIAEHGMAPEEAEELILDALPPFPSYEGNGKYLVRGQTEDGTYAQVVYIVDPDGRTLYVIHARPLTNAEKRKLRRRRR